MIFKKSKMLSGQSWRKWRTVKENNKRSLIFVSLFVINCDCRTSRDSRRLLPFELISRETLSSTNGLHNEPKKLLTPVSIGNYSTAVYDQVTSALFNMTDRTLIKPLNETTTFSQKKLDKAEAKLREKQEKRARDGAIAGEIK